MCIRDSASSTIASPLTATSFAAAAFASSFASTYTTSTSVLRKLRTAVWGPWLAYGLAARPCRLWRFVSAS